MAVFYGTELEELDDEKSWEPKQFRSSRSERTEKIDYKPEDFMDEEDLSEFGISARRVKTSIEAGVRNAEKHLLAWERSTQISVNLVFRRDELKPQLKLVCEMPKNICWHGSEALSHRSNQHYPLVLKE
ncbi:unnamed protein product [Gongylonema pulchrum]|uniref:DUF1604 domain-containing protein n=1 Tax=Gongylonema pulchrum TaxID=637853 RepID=A0A183E2D2_9BILA|nr:unnamed protein product [Gongylonema pulchrum]